MIDNRLINTLHLQLPVREHLTSNTNENTDYITLVSKHVSVECAMLNKYLGVKNFLDKSIPDYISLM